MCVRLCVYVAPVCVYIVVTSVCDCEHDLKFFMREIFFGGIESQCVGSLG